MSTADGFFEFIIDAFREALKSVYDDAFYTQVTDYVAFMGYTILVWDHIISFGDEVQYIWMRPKSPATYLFFINRYFTPLAFIGNLVAYFSQWPDEVRVRFLFAIYLKESDECKGRRSCTIIALEVAALLMLLRVWALYNGRNMIIGSVVVLLVLETAVFAWLMTRSEAVTHDYTVRPCTMIFDPGLKGWPSLSAWLPLLYDTYVTVLTLYRCIPSVRRSSAGHIFRILMRDGLLYYSVIFLVNFILAIMIVAAPPPIKNIAAQLEQMLTVAMISRITLSLRRSAAQHHQGLVTSDDNAYRFDLDGWRAAQNECPHARAQRSSTVCQHISVVSRNDLISESALSTDSGGKREDKDEHSGVGNGRRSASLGTDSFGILSISPAHSNEAAAAAGIAFYPVDRAAVIVDPSMLNDRSAYELRVMRPAHCPITNNHVLHL